tara:strand:+ start:3359 stop:3547 length:189 start_codon:yes stop_codon:yes gene_type:complete
MSPLLLLGQIVIAPTSAAEFVRAFVPVVLGADPIAAYVLHGIESTDPAFFALHDLTYHGCTS